MLPSASSSQVACLAAVSSFMSANKSLMSLLPLMPNGLMRSPRRQCRNTTCWQSNILLLKATLVLPSHISGENGALLCETVILTGLSTSLCKSIGTSMAVGWLFASSISRACRLTCKIYPLPVNCRPLWLCVAAATAWRHCSRLNHMCLMRW